MFMVPGSAAIRTPMRSLSRRPWLLLVSPALAGWWPIITVSIPAGKLCCLAALLSMMLLPKLLSIDDLADRPHLADVLLDQGFFGEATEKRYQQLVPRLCCQLLGPHYALLSPEYAQMYPLVPLRSELRRVLVSFGGWMPPTSPAVRCKHLWSLRWSI